VKKRIVELSSQRYRAFNDRHFWEELLEQEGMVIGRETVRKIRREAGILPKCGDSMSGLHFTLIFQDERGKLLPNKNLINSLYTALSTQGTEKGDAEKRSIVQKLPNDLR